MEIDSKTFKVSKDIFYKTNSTKTQVVVGISLRKGGNHIKRLSNKDYGKSKKWNTFTIKRDGTIYQHFNEKYYSDFIGIKVADKQSISIVLENMGCLTKEPTGEYVNWLNEYCDDKYVINKSYFGYDYWEVIPDEQIDSLVSLCGELCDKYSIPKLFIDYQQFNKSVSKYKGILFRSNYIDNSSDITPLFRTNRINVKLLS